MRHPYLFCQMQIIQRLFRPDFFYCQAHHYSINQSFRWADRPSIHPRSSNTSSFSDLLRKVPKNSFLLGKRQYNSICYGRSAVWKKNRDITEYERKVGYRFSYFWKSTYSNFDKNGIFAYSTNAVYRNILYIIAWICKKLRLKVIYNILGKLSSLQGL